MLSQNSGSQFTQYQWFDKLATYEQSGDKVSRVWGLVESLVKFGLSLLNFLEHGDVHQHSFLGPFV